VTTTTTRPRTGARHWLELLDAHRCACPGCEGPLTSSQYPSWRRCQDCGCCWTISDCNGQRREDLFANPRCPARNTDAEEER
jgi:hypothetical protein